MKALLRGAAAVIVSGAALAAADASQAKSFGPATGALVYLAAPVVTTGTTSGTAAFDGNAVIFSTTGSLTAATGLGAADGTVTFSDLVGTTTSEDLTDLLSFTDSSGGKIEFDGTSVETISYSSSSSSTAVSVYILGTAYDTTLGLTPSATSVTLTLDSTSGSAYSAAASIASPPSMVSSAPEPSTWALMIAGVAMVGAALRFRRRTAVIAA